MSEKSRARGLSLDDFAPLTTKKITDTGTSSSKVSSSIKKPDGRVLPPSISSSSKFTVLGTLPDTSKDSPVEFTIKDPCKTLTVLEPHMEETDPSNYF